MPGLAADPGGEAPVREGRYAFAGDEIFRAVFRSGDRAKLAAGFVVSSLAVVGLTLRVLLQEPSFVPLAWGIAGIVDVAAIWALHIVRKNLERGDLVVDASEKRVFLGRGAELSFHALRSLRIDGEALVLDHDSGILRLRLPPGEAREAAVVVSRLIELPVVASLLDAP
ncbi:MAG TPA: hypothetical protein VGD74_10270 [Vulgatibacter sp.]